MVQDYVAMIESRWLCVVTLAPRPDAVAVREGSRAKVAYRPGFDPIAALEEALRRDTPRIRSPASNAACVAGGRSKVFAS
jgi:hypothetical protein